MNERIQQLKEQASSYASTKSKEVEEWQWIYENKLAELIMKDCIDICDQHPSKIGYNNWSGDSVASDIIERIKKNFGIKS